MYGKGKTWHVGKGAQSVGRKGGGGRFQKGGSRRRGDDDFARIGRALVRFGRYQNDRPVGLYVDEGTFSLASVMSVWGLRPGYNSSQVLQAARQNMLHENGQQRIIIYPEGNDTMISVAPRRHARAAAAQPEELSEESSRDDDAMEALEVAEATDAVCDAAFVAAATAGHVEVVKYFMEEVGQSRKVFSAALGAAAGAGNLEIVALLVEHSRQ